jgi:hypothetical protein
MQGDAFHGCSHLSAVGVQWWGGRIPQDLAVGPQMGADLQLEVGRNFTSHWSGVDLELHSRSKGPAAAASKVRERRDGGQRLSTASLGLGGGGGGGLASRSRPGGRPGEGATEG